MRLDERIREIKGKTKPRFRLGLFLCLSLGLWMSGHNGGVSVMLAEEEAAPSTIPEEMTAEEKGKTVNLLIEEGDRLFERSDYDRANATYERVFLLDPKNVVASDRIDRLKKKMMAEGRSETELVTHVYDAEIDARVRFYKDRAQQLMAEKKWGEARFTIEKILLITPLDKDAQKLYKEIGEKMNAGAK